MVVERDVNQQELIVIGGGLVGAALAYGAGRCGVPVCLLDQGDVALRASRGNFGLIGLAGKGAGRPEYAGWTQSSCRLWGSLHQELLELSGVDSGFAQPGGFWFGFSDEELAARQTLLTEIAQTAGIEFEMMDRDELQRHLPPLGAKIVGGSFCALEGHANPLMLLQALFASIKKQGGSLVTGADIVKITYQAASPHFKIIAKDGRIWLSDRLVLANGLGISALAEQVGLNVTMTTSRGQILITERLKPFLRFPTMNIRQTAEGTVQIGSTTEYVGFDEGTTVDKIAWLARRAATCFPQLARVRIVRAWGALRPLTQDGYPIYGQSKSCPGAYVVTCHSGVALAPIHAFTIAPWVSGLTPMPAAAASFTAERFDMVEV